MKAMDLERAIVQHVIDWSEDHGMNFSVFARLAFPDDNNPSTRWRKIRNAGSHGKPQRLNVADVQLLARATGKRASELIFAVEQLVDSGHLPRPTTRDHN